MKKLIFSIIILMLITITPSADILEPGVSNETQYKEIVFITGEPVEFTGELKITQSGRGDQIKYTYDYNLRGPDGATLTRRVTYLVEEKTNPELKQTSLDLTIDPNARISERITIGDKTYILEDIILNKTSTTHDKSIIKYTAGTWNGRKEYSQGENRVIMEIFGESYKYDNTWSTLETAMIRHVITYQNVTNQAGRIHETNGTVEYGVTNIRERR